MGDPETERFVKPGQELTYTIYFENKADAGTAAQEIRVTEQLDPSLDWSTFRLGEVAFNNQIDNNLSGKTEGVSEVKMSGTNYYVRTEASCDATTGKVSWYLRIVDKTTTDEWPTDIDAGILPPNDETFRGEGHLTYRVNVRNDVEPGARIDASATIVFDYNDPIETDPAWWNTVGGDPVRVVFDARGNSRPGAEIGNAPESGVYYALPATNPSRAGYAFLGWATEDGTIIESLSQLPPGATHATLYAVWAPRYSIAFDPDGGEGEMAALECTGEEAATLPPCAFAKADCRFLGWATRRGGEVLYLDGATVTGMTTIPGAEVTLYAAWADAATTVPAHATDGPDALQKAIDAAPDGGTVLAYPGTYGPIDAADRALTVRALFGVGSTAPCAAMSSSNCRCSTG